MAPSFVSDKMHELSISGKNQTPPIVLKFKDRIDALAFSPHLLSRDLLGVAFPSKIVIGSVRFQDEYDDLPGEVEYLKIQEFSVSSRVHAISWSPETNLKIAPKKLLFAYSTSDSKITVVSSNVTTFSSQVLQGHTSYVNDIAFNPIGNFLASGSDDLTCQVRLTDKEYEIMSKFYLKAPVVAVKWHHEDPVKVLVAQKDGIITFFNVTTKTAIMSLRSSASPMITVDWSPSNSQFVAAIAGGQLFVWNVTNPSMAHTERTNSNVGLNVKFFPLNEQKIVSLGAPENVLKVSYLHNPNNPVSLATLELATGLTIHQQLPYACTAVYSSIHIYRLTGL